MLLDGRKLLITGVLTDRSIAYSVARRAQEEGAEVILTGFGRGMRITERMAKRLPTEAEVLELDVNDPAALEAVAGHARRALGTPRRRAARHRLRARRRARRPVPADPERLGDRRLRDERVLAQGAGGGAAAAAGARRGRRAWSAWTSTPASRGRPTTGPACPRPRWSRSTATSRATSARAACAPTSSPPARCRPWRPRTSRASRASREIWERQAPLGWDLADPSPVADACLFLLSPLARAITGEILHVDGGVHAMGAAPVVELRRR